MKDKKELAIESEDKDLLKELGDSEKVREYANRNMILNLCLLKLLV
jgi:hypothetical protein